MKNFVSIIIPVFNSKKFILQTLESIENQTYKNYEIIIVDDCSTDGSYELIEKLKIKNKKIRLYKTKKNSGTVAAPRNLGIKKAKGNIVCFNDSDDIWKKDKLEIQISKIKNRKTVISTAADYFSKESRSSLIMNYLRRLIQFYIFKKINKKGSQWIYLYNPIIVSSVLIFKKDLNKIAFDDDINTREDLDMWIRLREKNYKFLFINKILVSIRRRDKSLSSNLQKELITVINSLGNVYFKINSFKKTNFFLIGIIIKFLITFFRKNIKPINMYLKYFTTILVIFIFIVFYSPLFWYLGSPLLYKDKFNNNENLKNIVVFSGHGSTSYYNITYQYRYKDIKNILERYSTVENIFILGRLQEIPEQKIIESLLVNDGVDSNKIKIIYEDYQSTALNIKNIYNFIKEKNINKLIFVTSPYHSKRSYLLWKQFSDLDVKFWKGYEWPEKNKFFEYSKNKKIIIYEHISIFYNKLKKNIK